MFGQVIKKVRKEKGMTQEDVARALNVKTSDTNVISITFDRKFESKYKINIYKVRGDSNES